MQHLGAPDLVNLQAVIFDFDGVLADTEKLHLRAFQEVLGARGVQLSAEDYFARYLGLDDYHVLLAVAEDCGLPPGDAHVRALLDHKARRYRELLGTSPALFEGVGPLVREWSRRVPLAIASGALRREIEEVLHRSRLLECFVAIVSANDVARGKPAPDPFLLALDRLRAAPAFGRPAGPAGREAARAEVPDSGPRFSPDRCIVIEDSLPGIAAARAAGMRAVAVATNHPAERLEDADLVVPSVTSLNLATLDRVASGAREKSKRG